MPPMLPPPPGGGGLLFVVGEAIAEEKSPKSPPKLGCRAFCMGGEVVCFGGGAGLASKKLPPLSGLEACRVLFVGDARPEKADGFAVACVGCGELKDREPNASPSPPSDCAFDCC